MKKYFQSLQESKTETSVQCCLPVQSVENGNLRTQSSLFSVLPETPSFIFFPFKTLSLYSNSQQICQKDCIKYCAEILVDVPFTLPSSSWLLESLLICIRFTAECRSVKRQPTIEISARKQLMSLNQQMKKELAQNGVKFSTF